MTGWGSFETGVCLLAEPCWDAVKALEGDGEGGSQGVFFRGLGLGLGLRGLILLMEAVVGSMKLQLN